jgi:hypothetical protein
MKSVSNKSTDHHQKMNGVLETSSKKEGYTIKNPKSKIHFALLKHASA